MLIHEPWSDYQHLSIPIRIHRIMKPFKCNLLVPLEQESTRSNTKSRASHWSRSHQFLSAPWSCLWWWHGSRGWGGEQTEREHRGSSSLLVPLHCVQTGCKGRWMREGLQKVKISKQEALFSPHRLCSLRSNHRFRYSSHSYWKDY